LRDGACVFPWCQRAADRSDCDHIIPWRPEARGGPTCTCNLAPLCRFHHRAKTHADNHIGNAYTWWNYESLGEGKYLWKGPKGSRLLRTNHGVYDLVTTSTPDNNAGTSDPASADGQGQIDKGVHAAQIVVNHITATLPNAAPMSTTMPTRRSTPAPRALVGKPRAPAGRWATVRNSPARQWVRSPARVVRNAPGGKWLPRSSLITTGRM